MRLRRTGTAVAKAPASRAAPADRLIARRIRDSGNLGLTAAQLSKSTGYAPSEVAVSLDHLAERKIVARVGRGLWIDRPLLGDPARGSGFVPPAHYLARFTRTERIDAVPYEGEIQFRPNTEEPIHRWWPYVQGFSAGFVRNVASRYAIGPGARVFDPYAGSGTVPVVARALGAEGVGVELMPISAFVATAKQIWDVAPEELVRAGDALLRSSASSTRAPLPFLRETARQFAPGPLDSLRRLRGSLEASDSPKPVRTLLQLAFARILVPSSRMRRSPCLGYGPKPVIPRSGPNRFFREAVDRMAEDLARLQEHRDSWGPPATIREEDSRNAALPAGSVDLAVTSPPYVNGMDYVMNYKIELAWLGFANSYGDLRLLKGRMVACDNLPRQAALHGLTDPGVQEDAWLVEILGKIRQNLASKLSYRRNDMDAVVASYFADLRPTIARVFDGLRPGGRFVIVNGDSLMAGTYVPGDLLFARIAERAGFAVERFEIARTRRSGQRREFLLRESILTLRKPPN
jgi:DNA modification methylase